MTADQNQDLWDVCPPGLLHETASAVPSPQRFGWLMGTMMAFAVIGVFLFVNYSNRAVPEPEPQTVDCQITRENMMAFVRYEIKDCSFSKKLGCHIRHCPECYKAYCKARCSLKQSERPQKVILKPTRATQIP